MEQVLLVPDLQGLILRHFTIKELCRLRVTRELREVISEYCRVEKMDKYRRLFEKRLKMSMDDVGIVNVDAVLSDTKMIVLYNYYHEILKYGILVNKNSIDDLTRSLRRVPTDLKWARYEKKLIWGSNETNTEILVLNRVRLEYMNLYDVMSHIYMQGDILFMNESIPYLKNKLYPDV